jgi:hypothetical protein
VLAKSACNTSNDRNDKTNEHFTTKNYILEILRGPTVGPTERLPKFGWLFIGLLSVKNVFQHGLKSQRNMQIKLNYFIGEIIQLHRNGILLMFNVRT